ncbi:MAG TPA: hypothetical protein VHN14_19000 [Kofleriaceae bacterium]|jgi:hypothetical protein|nr:hypothetical protein [Kofleriaceae bacterium]
MVRPRVLAALLGGLGLATGGSARADDDFAGASVIFVRGSSLLQVDAKGKGETEVAQLPAKVTVRALRSDAGGTVLLADLAGKWAWMPLDGSTRSLTELPCADGPAQLAEDGTSVLCRSPRSAQQSILVDLSRGAAAGRPGRPGRPGGTDMSVTLDIPPASARLVESGTERMLVWADATGVWAAPPGDLKTRTHVAPDAPLRGFLASPDGERAIGVYPDQVFTDARHTRTAEVLMMLQLDSQGARRKAIRDGVAVEWSHDAQWVLVQDGASACIMRASGGQYKCWKGYTAASLSSDGRWGLALGNRDGTKKQAPARPAAKPAGKPSGKSSGNAPPVRPPEPGDPDGKPWDALGEPSDEPEAGEAPPANDDVSIAPPSGPLSLYRLRTEGAFTDRPTLLVKVIDGAAVWVPKAP